MSAIEIVKAGSRHFSDFGWLKTYWLFSFSSYFDPRNIQFGALRVFNDDIVQPGTGFPTHPHEEMEIITIVLDGEMTHEDSMGNKTVIRAGDVQRMSAGTGLTHSEFNLAPKPVHFYQIWIFPDKAGLRPTYDQKSYAPDTWRNRLLPVASGQNLPGAVTFHTDATIYRCDLDRGMEVTLKETPGRRIFADLTKGRLSANGSRMDEKDQARIDVEEPLVLRADDPAGF
ncbi:MAG: pirin family protein, partial [Thermodesulfobacteriota bacterium]